MTGAMLLALAVRWAGRAAVAVAVGVFVLAVLGVVSWVGAVYLWALLFVVSVVHATTHDTGDDGDDQ